MEFINEFMWQEMRNREHIYIHSGFLEKKCKTMINTACINFFQSFDFKIFVKMTYSCLIRVFFLIIHIFIQIKKSQTFM